MSYQEFIRKLAAMMLQQWEAEQEAEKTRLAAGDGRDQPCANMVISGQG